MHLLFGALAALQAQATQASKPVPAADSIAIVARAVAREKKFVNDVDGLVPHVQSIHALPRCGWVPNGKQRRLRADVEPGSWMFSLSKVMWNNYDNRLNLCLLWVGRSSMDTPDQGVSIDAQLPPAIRSTVRTMRARTLQYLDSVGAILPHDPHVLGQRVRFDVDQHDSAAAMQAIGVCQSTDWWCLALAGYVRHTFHDEVAAEENFDGALAAMPDSIRCKWEDVGPLLGEGSRRQYSELTCAQRDSVNANLWFLADPLFLEPANERRNEHLSRYVLTQVRLIRDLADQLVPSARNRADVMSETVMRYGWPTHIGILYKNLWSVKYFNPEQRTVEVTWPDLQVSYRWPQVHSFPALSWLADPVAVTSAAWSNFAPGRTGVGAFDDEGWAPEFYFRAAGPIVPLETQVAFLRRQQTALAMVGAQWGTDTASHVAGPHRFGIMTSSGPGAELSGGSGVVNADGPHGLLGPIDSRRQLLSVEMIPLSRGAAGRARFGVAPPMPLDSMRRDSVALSDIVLLSATSDSGVIRDAQAATHAMLASVSLGSPKTIGLFWEIYGARMGDTISYSVRAIHHNDGALTSILSTFGARQTRDTVTISWTDVVNDDPVAGSESGVQVRGRGLNLNVGAYLAGRYTLEIIVGRRNTPTAITRQDIVIRRD